MQQFFDLHGNTIRFWLKTGAICFAVWMIYTFGFNEGRKHPANYCADRYDTITARADYQRCVVRIVERR
jgi:hypothetical protein